ncbi:MipA/OmpV family protein [Sphingopyxis sp. PAMC25046]|uniref:MipA/OmpV family protein n=1 Tax=Sphingopyxis sp. PAMC25046 TaxID=2565556 RepID=UPI00144895D8|nr:MipA/OmpV family protein [Sphingopyxis sp. PAMC25046]
MADELTPLEKQVIALALGDTRSSLMPRRNIFFWLFGHRATSLPLANPRLEALRRYAILRRTSKQALPQDECDRLCRAGYDSRQKETIDRLVAPNHMQNHFRVRTGYFVRRRAKDRAPGLLPPTTIPASGPSHLLTPPSIAKENMLNFSTPRMRSPLLLAMLPLAMAPAAVQAQPQRPLQGPSDTPDGSDDHIVVGVGGLYAPAYQGADDYRFQPLPMVDLKWGRFFVNLQDGIGANLFDSEHVTVGAGLTPVGGYRAKDTPDGIGKLSLGLGGRGFVKLRQGGFEATLGATKIITGNTEGIIADASLAYRVTASDKLMLIPSIGTTWGNRKHNNRYFGVTAGQSAASGLPQYRAGSGLADAKAELAVVYRLTDRIGVMAVGGVSSLLGDAKDSPIVYHKTRPYGIFAITYRF